MKPRPAPRRLAVVLAMCAALVVPACSSTASNTNTFQFSGATKLGTVIPATDRKKADDFSGDLLTGGTTKLSAYSGKVVLINFFGSWCGPCQVETPGLVSLYSSVKAKGVEFVGIDIKDDRGNAQDFLKAQGVTYPVVYDFAGKTIINLGNPPASPPFTYLIDKTGKVAAVYFGALTPKDIEPAIDKLLAEK